MFCLIIVLSFNYVLFLILILSISVVSVTQPFFKKQNYLKQCTVLLFSLLPVGFFFFFVWILFGS
uniref:Uncharacterized protein n=1 Tax=Rhizophora mucronata TaxID=61149 RepID=A0A2P2JIE4_RHIMU